MSSTSSARLIGTSGPHVRDRPGRFRRGSGLFRSLMLTNLTEGKFSALLILTRLNCWDKRTSFKGKQPLCLDLSLASSKRFEVKPKVAKAHKKKKVKK